MKHELKSFTQNYQENSTDVGFQFTFYCDSCSDGYKSSFIESEIYKKKNSNPLLRQGLNLVGSLLGGKTRNADNIAEHDDASLPEPPETRSPEWQEEHELAFEQTQNEAMQHFHHCQNCLKYVCGACYSAGEALCLSCAAPLNP